MNRSGKSALPARRTRVMCFTNTSLRPRTYIFADGQVRFVIQNARKTPVGMIDLANFDAKNNRAEVGVVIRKRYAGKGYGQAAVLKLLNYAQEILGLCQVYAIVSCDNVRAKNLFNKTGFQTVATLPQWLALGGKYVDALLYQFVFQSK